jgi:glycosyltransferase involved in cell wall biosynthesis
VSVCNITRNRPALLALLAECVAAQAYPAERLEWVVIDDSGPGPEPDLAVAQQAGIRVKLVRLQEPQPIGAKRNLCHAHASGDLLVVMDDDDYYPPSRVPEAVAVLSAGEGDVALCTRVPLLLLPEGSRWLSPSFHAMAATANTLAYSRAYLEQGHGFDPEAWEAEEPSFLEGSDRPPLPLDPAASLTCIGHGGNTVDKRLWIARNGAQRFEVLGPEAPGFPPEVYLERYRRALGIPETAPPCAPGSAEPAEEPKQLRPWRVAVITPYCTESPQLLQRCHASVLAQHYPCTHFLVADGPGLAELAGWYCRHIVLGASHGDNGNTPRSIGALAAMNEGFDAVAFLDADNWFSPEHLQAAIECQAATEAAVVFSDRHIVFPDGQRLTLQPEEDRLHRLADTSCMVVFEPAFSSLALWAQMPRQLAPQCDRVMFAHLMATQSCAWTNQATLFFETWYAGHFLAAGLLPPATAKFLALQPAGVWEEAARSFRRRSPTPVYAGSEGIGPDKPRINLVTILGAPCSGGTLLQAGLCRHLGFAGIPENQFLYHCVARMGSDHRLRHGGAELRQQLAEPAPDENRLKPFDLQGRGLETALNPERSYTLLEAYFRAVQALLPAEAMGFARAYGQVHVLDRSCSLALVADVLFRCLPEHRAVLMLRDPLKQIAALRGRMACHPEDWAFADKSLEGLCRVVLESLARPLHAAPVGQLLLVSHRRLVEEPQPVVEAVYGTFETAPTPYYALEPLDHRLEPVLNPVHERVYADYLEALPSQLLQDQERPWKLGCLAGELSSSSESKPQPEALFSAVELEELEALLAPLQLLIRALDAEEPLSAVSLPPPNGQTELVNLVEQAVQGLLPHAAADARWEV